MATEAVNNHNHHIPPTIATTTSHHSNNPDMSVTTSDPLLPSVGDTAAYFPSARIIDPVNPDATNRSSANSTDATNSINMAAAMWDQRRILPHIKELGGEEDGEVEREGQRTAAIVIQHQQHTHCSNNTHRCNNPVRLSPPVFTPHTALSGWWYMCGTLGVGSTVFPAIIGAYRSVLSYLPPSPFLPSLPISPFSPSSTPTNNRDGNARANE